MMESEREVKRARGLAPQQQDDTIFADGGAPSSVSAFAEAVPQISIGSSYIPSMGSADAYSRATMSPKSALPTLEPNPSTANDFGRRAGRLRASPSAYPHDGQVSGQSKGQGVQGQQYLSHQHEGQGAPGQGTAPVRGSFPQMGISSLTSNPHPGITSNTSCTWSVQGELPPPHSSEVGDGSLGWGDWVGAGEDELTTGEALWDHMPPQAPPQGPRTTKSSLQEDKPAAITRSAEEREDNQVYAVWKQDTSDTVISTNIMPQICLPHDSAVCSVSYSWDGDFLATGSDRSAKIFKVNSRNPIAELTIDDAGIDPSYSYVRAVRFSPDGNYE